MIENKEQGVSADKVLLDAPFHINWNYTNICDFNCTHCYSRDNKITNELSSAQKHLVAKSLAKSHVFSVNLGGGEPLLCNDVLENITYLARNNVHVLLSTNGWNTSFETTYALAQAGLGRIILSLDSANASRHDAFRNRVGSFDKVIQAAALYQQQNIPTSVSTIITSRNFDELEDIIVLAHSLGCSAVELKRLRLSGNAREQTDLLLSSKQEEGLYRQMAQWKRRFPLDIQLVYGTQPVEGIDAGCPCGRTSLCVLANGDIAPCVYNPRIIGNALVDDIDDLWRTSPLLQDLRRHFVCHGLEA